MAHLHYTCWRCGEDNLLYGDPCNCCDLIDVPDDFDCWNCGANNTVPDD